MHTGSDILDIEVFLHASEILFNTARKFKQLSFIDFGSGSKFHTKKEILKLISMNWEKIKYKI